MLYPSTPPSSAHPSCPHKVQGHGHLPGARNYSRAIVGLCRYTKQPLEGILDSQQINQFSEEVMARRKESRLNKTAQLQHSHLKKRNLTRL